MLKYLFLIQLILTIFNWLNSNWIRFYKFMYESYIRSYVFINFFSILKKQTYVWCFLDLLLWGHALSTYVKFSEKLTFLTPRYAHVRLRTRGLEMLVFRKILRTYLMDDHFVWFFLDLMFDFSFLYVLERFQ